MKVLLDENLPHALRHHLSRHDVMTAHYAGLAGIRNGRLLEAAAQAGFEVMVTKDQSIEYQQNLERLPLPIVVIESADSRIETLVHVIPQIEAALDELEFLRMDWNVKTVG